MSQPPLNKVKDDLLRNTPPQNLEAEQAVLGGVFLDNASFHHLIDILGTDDFYFPAHQIIFDAFLELYAKNTPPDLVTVAEHLKSKGKLDAIGGGSYLADLTQSVISASNVAHHARIVRDKSILRQLISSAAGIISNCFEGSGEVDILLGESEQAIFAITQKTTGSVIKGSKELVDKVFTDLQARVDRQELVTGVPTGYHKLNEMTAGLQPSDLIIVAGRPSMGKTAFALNVAMRAAVDHQVPTAIFSLEMSMDQLMQRMLCVQGMVDLSSLRKGFISDDDWARLYDAADKLSPAPIFIDDTPALGSLELRARCRRLKSEKNIGLVVVDYLQLMRASRRIDSREQEISEISRSLKALAKEINVPVVALSQLNRKVEERTDKRPLLSDLRESGAIEQDADVILFLYREDAYKKRGDESRTNTAEIIIGKQRNGPVGRVELGFFDYCTAFVELDYIHQPSENGFSE